VPSVDTDQGEEDEDRAQDGLSLEELMDWEYLKQGKTHVQINYMTSRLIIAA